ncbi:hypothetical protein QYM36_014195 [Artemia franciscana]|uniref:Endonuclease/exonuclease/phosphatase domain-containing protein n=1 Tax=Artemia franciscana TaxID=6661 RepID=A0AA88KXU2_ARTSF|nr:hypothetical protein QYM36_014195 [Artemia franciscana]
MIRIKRSLISITIIQVYASDSSKPDVESEIFYLQLQSPLDTGVLIIGDFNTVAGTAVAENGDIMGKFGLE